MTAGERMRVTVCKACERECEGVREKKNSRVRKDMKDHQREGKREGKNKAVRKDKRCEAVVSVRMWIHVREYMGEGGHKVGS